MVLPIEFCNTSRAWVRKRAGYQCTYLSPKGIRCNQTAKLQNDHIQAYALGGSSKDIHNLRPLCKVHNLYCAKRDFPHKFKQQKNSMTDPLFVFLQDKAEASKKTKENYRPTSHIRG